MQDPAQSQILSHPKSAGDGGQCLFGGLRLARARAHEATGPARHSFAMALAGTMQGPVFWVRPGWLPGRLHGPGMVAFADPGRFTFIEASRPIDILWSIEEVMRAGVVPLVVGELPDPPGLTPVRRLHLAGETGAREGSVAPIALLLTPQGAAPGVESRWHMAPAHSAGAQGAAWQLTRLRARQAPVRGWCVTRRGAGFALTDPENQPASARPTPQYPGATG